MNAGIERAAGEFGVIGIGGRDQQSLGRQREQFLERGAGRNSVALLDEPPARGRGIGDGHQLEAVIKRNEIGNMLDLGDQARAGNGDPQSGHVAPIGRAGFERPGPKR